MKNKSSSSLKFQVTRRILVLSSFITGMIIAAQFTYDYLHGLREIESQTETFIDLQMGSLAKAEWDLNRDQRTKIVEGFLNDPGISGVILKLNQEEITYGEVTSSEDTIVREIVHKDPSGSYNLGSMQVFVTDQGLIETLKTRGVVVLVSQVLKTLIMVIGILAIIDLLIIRRLQEIEDQLRSDEMSEAGDEIEVLRTAIGSYSKQIIEQSLHQGRIESEMEAAKSIQESLLAKRRTVPGLEIAHHYESAEKVGGDWFGYYVDTVQKVCFVFCGDVTGHGISAALITGVVTGSIESQFSHYFDLSKSGKSYHPKDVISNILTHTNNAIYNTSNNRGFNAEQKFRNSRLMTLAAFAIDLETGKVWQGSAGHNPLFHLKIGGFKSRLVTGTPLGFEPNVSDWKIKEFKLDPGETIIAYTDGLLENQGPNGEVLSRRFFRRELPSYSVESSESILGKILHEGKSSWKEHPPNDDCAVMVIKWHGINSDLDQVNRREAVA